MNEFKIKTNVYIISHRIDDVNKQDKYVDRINSKRATSTITIKNKLMQFQDSENAVLNMQRKQQD